MPKTSVLVQDDIRLKRDTVSTFSKWIFGVMTDHYRGVFRCPSFDPLLKVCFRKSRVYSWGGADPNSRPFVNIAAHPVMWMVGNRHAVRSLYEYEFLKYVPDIGPFRKCWKAWIAATIAHELAHALHWYADTPEGSHIRSFIPNTISSDNDDHGLFWQELYRVLRREFVNGVDWDHDVAHPTVKRELRRYASKFKTTSRRSDGGRYVTYTSGDKTVTLFKKHSGCVHVVESGVLIETQWTSLVAARNALISR